MERKRKEKEVCGRLRRTRTVFLGLFFLYPCFEGRLLLAAHRIEENFKRSTSNTKDQIVTVRVDIDGCGAGDETTGVFRLAELGVKQVVGFLNSQPHDQ